MKKLVVEGGARLCGEVNISGCKNAAVAILPACILANDICYIENVPNVSDIKLLLKVLTQFGATYEFDNNCLTIDTRNLENRPADDEIIGKLRGSAYFMGALLGRFHKATVNRPGGCALGSRPIDQHIKGFRRLGAMVIDELGKVEAVAENGLVGSDIFLDTVSVGATINLMLAACTANGNTTIENCAMEPHVVDVANFLNTCGAEIKGAGTHIIKIKGVEKLHGCSYSVIPDQIEAGTFMAAAAATHGDVVIKNIIPKHQEAITAKLEEMNVGVTEGSDWIRIFDKGEIKGTEVKTMPYPGFPTDMQPQIVALMSIASGESEIKETVWESRFSYVSELQKMGANITRNDRIANVEGVKSLKGSSLKCPDLRAGAAFVIAALAATGTSEIYDIHFIDRGYENIEDKLSKLGAKISRVDYEPEEEF